MDTTFEETQQAASRVLNRTKDKVEEFGRTVQSKIDDSRVPTANTLQNAANKMQATADYVRDHGVSDMMADVETLVRRNPGPSIVAAAAIGFLLGRVFRGNGRS